MRADDLIKLLANAIGKAREESLPIPEVVIFHGDGDCEDWDGNGGPVNNVRVNADGDIVLRSILVETGEN